MRNIMQENNLTKERILDEATRLAHQKGFRATSLNDLLLAAGVKKGTLYYHFSGKDDIGLAVLERAKARFLAWIDQLLFAPPNSEGLERFFVAVLELHRGNGFVGGCLWGNTALEMSDANARDAACVNGVFEEWCERVEKAILAGQQTGQIRCDIPGRDLAQMVVATVEGGIMMSRLKKEEGPLKTCLDSLRVFLRATPGEWFFVSIVHEQKETRECQRF